MNIYNDLYNQNDIIYENGIKNNKCIMIYINEQSYNL